jgi:hypothetical protein
MPELEGNIITGMLRLEKSLPEDQYRIPVGGVVTLNYSGFNKILAVKCKDGNYVGFKSLNSAKHSNIKAPVFFHKAMKNKVLIDKEVNLRLN